MMKIGNNLKRIREIKGFSQSEIAAKLFISQRAYSDLENDKTKLDIERLESIAIIFNISSNDLLTFDENNRAVCPETGQKYELRDGRVVKVES